MTMNRSPASLGGSPAAKVPGETKTRVDSTSSRKRSRSDCASESPIKDQQPAKRRSPRRCNGDREQNCIGIHNGSIAIGKQLGSPKSPRKRLFGPSDQKPKWNPRDVAWNRSFADPAQMQAAKQALHLATPPANVVCREVEQKKLLNLFSAGIANAIDLADRFLPKLESLNCENANFTKVAAASGDIRRALDICRSAIEVLEAELRDPTDKKETEIVILCSLVRLFRQHKNSTTLGEASLLNRSYLDICKATQIRPIGMTEFADMCRALADQVGIQ
ncbi:hypothetical protein B296_00005865 [Ensete ventricosum]|uniref:Cdc6 C-terminal domain-containing protein n=1 Tax=Ensete ventricosum TaxID=4639 RepID=A0A427A6S7_ENSVE|nr:hypothetical protein B296_00005865 [Ensete ventricosum]